MKTLVETIDGFNIYFEALPEYESPRDHFDIEAEGEDFFEKIENGYYAWFCAKVTAEKNGIELAVEYLGGCCYDNDYDFYEQYHDDCFADMAANVVAEAKKAIQKLCE